ncbi:MAG: nicotinate-nucleotide--dimethylbenzimidazole phosphoribosyltransferase [Selenomonadaceae bacterium]|nr:nicotinate-nucleotide--dimethylbenzimidazole phosphoribosyltransferase [Selenomonadaceae bacterium]
MPLPYEKFKDEFGFTVSQYLQFLMADPDNEDFPSELMPFIGTADAEAVNFFTKALDKYVDPAYGLGELKELGKKYAGAAGYPRKSIESPFMPIFCADHGVAQENVSAYPPETTLHMAANYVISQGAAANAFANFTRGSICVFDMGINGDTSSLPINKAFKIGNGTANAAQGMAMSRHDAVKSLLSGIHIACQAYQQGCTVFLPDEMGISNTTASAAITAVMCGISPEEATGRGTNISDERLQKKIATVKKMLEVNQPQADDPVGVLAAVGGYELGAIAGLIIGGAMNGVLTILDGFNTSAAALIATAISPAITDFLAASHIGGERGHKYALEKLGLKPVMKLDIKLGEAIGSSLVADLLVKTLLTTSYLHLPDMGKEQLMKKVEWDNMPRDSVTLTDKTFNYYTDTMPSLSKDAMEGCQKRLNTLSKPIYSLGHIEKIARQLSGILDEDLPNLKTRKTLLLFGLDKYDHKKIVGADPDDIAIDLSYDEKKQAYTFEQACLLNGYADLSHIKLEAGHLYMGHSQMDAFEYGRQMGEDLSLHSEIIGLALIDGRPKLIQEIADALINPDGSLKYSSTSWIAHLNEQQQLLVSAGLGAMVAAAHNRSLVVLDNDAVVAIARYAVQMLPDLEPFLLPVQPTLYQMDIKAPGITALAGMALVDAALHALNDMKTFTETQVAVANDGPGKGLQN